MLGAGAHTDPGPAAESTQLRSTERGVSAHLLLTSAPGTRAAVGRQPDLLLVREQYGTFAKIAV